MVSHCPGCGKTTHHRVIDSRSVGGAKSLKIRRRKSCAVCDYRYTTYEVPSELYEDLEELEKYKELFGSFRDAAETRMLLDHIGNLSQRNKDERS